MPNCKGCGKLIQWLTTKQGKQIPIDPESEELRVAEIELGKAVICHTYKTHFETYPKASEFRKTRRE